MKGKDFRSNEKTIELLDGNHKIAMDFGTFEQLEEIYGDTGTAFAKLTPKNAEGERSPIKFTDIKKFLTAGINSCIEDPDDHLTPFQVGRLLNISKMPEYSSAILSLVNDSFPEKESNDDDNDEKN